LGVDKLGEMCYNGNIGKDIFCIGGIMGIIIKVGSRRYKEIPFSEQSSIPKRKRFKISGGWEKKQKVVEGIDGNYYIEYLNGYGYKDIVRASFNPIFNIYMPEIWEPNEPIGWKNPDGTPLPCQWCPDSSDAIYREEYKQYMCDDCFSLHQSLVYEDE